MAKQFRFPDIGEGITEGEVVRWLVKEGDEIEADQTIAEIETDKAVVEMPSPYAGTVLKLYFKEKDIVKVGDVLMAVGEKGETLAEIGPAPGAAVKAPPISREPRPEAPRGAGELPLATPKIRKLAAELGIKLEDVRGAGPGGRILEDDVRAAKAAATLPKAMPKVKAKFDFYGAVDRLPLRGIRRATAKHMAESVRTAAHVTHIDEASAIELVKLREKIMPQAEARKIRLTYLPFIVKALLPALKLHPMLNATLNEDEEEIILKKYYNIGIAVDVPDGLIVPVIKGAEQKSVLDIAEDIQNLAQAAKARTLDLADLKGGTFSITNVGVLGGEAATPIINFPEVAILATLKIADRVRAVGGEIKIVKTLPLCLSFDHRVIDGADAARFMNDLKKFIEEGVLLEQAAWAAG
jgi:pyruvate dehydrogenase E2 component (dihydrolipoamide acetyltransferase)